MPLEDLTFEASLKLTKVDEATFENDEKSWTWPMSTVIPGGVLMSQCAAAASETVPANFIVDNLQAHFLAGPKVQQKLRFKVKQLSNGKRFAVRAVTIEQNDVVVLAATVGFVNRATWTGPQVKYSSSRQTSHEVEKITLDDLEPFRTRQGSFMKVQRLPVVFKGSSTSPESGIAGSVMQIIPSIQDGPGTLSHILGIINISDYHVMDVPMQLGGVTFGWPDINDYSRTPTENYMKIGTTLNHTIHFHAHDGFRADELVYIETETSWAKDGRAMVSSKIFSRDGLLIATCVQEAFHVLTEKAITKPAVKL